MTAPSLDEAIHYPVDDGLHPDLEWVQSEWPAIVSYAAVILKHREDAEDAANTALYKAHRATTGGFVPESMHSWFYAVVRNTALDTLKSRRRRRTEPLEALPEHPDSEPDSLTRLLGRETSAYVRGAISKLPPDFQRVIELRELEGLPYQEIAQQSGIPVGTVKSRLSRARQCLAELLAGNVGDYSFSS